MLARECNIVSNIGTNCSEISSLHLEPFSNRSLQIPKIAAEFIRKSNRIQPYLSPYGCAL